MGEVKRYLVDCGTCTDVTPAETVGACRMVLATDYAALEAECERLRADLLFLAEYITAESCGHPLPNYLAIGRYPLDVARAILEVKP